MPDVKHFDEDTALARAMDLFWRRGYEATSVQDLVDELGLSRSSLYATFGDKDRLYRSALQRYCHAEAGPRHDRLEAADSALEAVRGLLEGIAAAPAAFPDRRGCLVVNAAMERVPSDSATAEAVAAQLASFEATLTRVLRRGQERGELDPGQDAVAVARFLVAVVQGMRVVGKAGADPAGLGDVVEVALVAIRRA
ncbi:MAG: Transcriptional regulator, AcrR family [uncultured Solirubrobacteraceae bacterium]|uniref:Transcriptional regulator, AcrR family n=1 Tax=uncultured Solirubrobacteraceae bacterium TaxID=1162706 RepID=A0A6J4U1C2_9ACTN|nr:MAG: Transcriptional regulator, AcrR family [uncultured Solirubrobacteraceae bacterium]